MIFSKETWPVQAERRARGSRRRIIPEIAIRAIRARWGGKKSPFVQRPNRRYTEPRLARVSYEAAMREKPYYRIYIYIAPVY